MIGFVLIREWLTTIEKLPPGEGRTWTPIKENNIKKNNFVKSLRRKTILLANKTGFLNFIKKIIIIF
jgi:hypothetical protein